MILQWEIRPLYTHIGCPFMKRCVLSLGCHNYSLLFITYLYLLFIIIIIIICLFMLHSMITIPLNHIEISPKNPFHCQDLIPTLPKIGRSEPSNIVFPLLKIWRATLHWDQACFLAPLITWLTRPSRSLSHSTMLKSPPRIHSVPSREEAIQSHCWMALVFHWLDGNLVKDHVEVKGMFGLRFQNFLYICLAISWGGC